MNTLYFFGIVVAAIWAPHVVRGITTRARYYIRSHYGYTSNGV